MVVSTLSPRQLPPVPPHRRRARRTLLILLGLAVALLAAGTALAIWSPTDNSNALASQRTPAVHGHPLTATAPAIPVPVAFDPTVGAILPEHRVVAFYGVPGAAATGPAYQLTMAMLNRLRAQGAVYQKIDPTHPVILGIDLVVSVPDRFRGKSGTYSHHVDAATIQQYVAFCRKNHLLLFLDLNIGWANPLTELNSFDQYFKLPFVQVAIDPEWMFPRHNGIPGKNLSNVRASDLNPLIAAVGDMPMKYHVPRKIMIIHQYRGDGDGTTNPYNPAKAEIADKRNIIDDKRVDVVIHIDSVGGWPGDIGVKEAQYSTWVAGDMARYNNFQYGGFKIFYELESRHRLMTPAEVMAMKPAPMVVTYGN
jgi:hypothetical protein